jgi:drug/metabolite transporter (DMT)-like permease
VRVQLTKERTGVKRVHQFAERYGADISMVLIVSIWGIHIIVVKDALHHFTPLAFNAIRFSLAGLVLAGLASRHLPQLRMRRADFFTLLGWSLIGLVMYQILFVLGLARTTATNTALLISTMPVWTALLSVLLGLIVGRRMLLMGIGITLVGVVLVILSRAGADFSLASDDLTGSLLLLTAAIGSAVFNIKIKPIVDQYGGLTVALWTHWFTGAGLVIVALPDLIQLTPSDFSPGVWPNILYSAILASAGGYLTWNHALHVLGPTRAAAYNNLTPLVAALAGILVLGEPFTLGLLAGAVFTLVGIMIVRSNAHPQALPSAPVREFKPSAAASAGD